METQKKAIYITVGIIIVLAGLIAAYFFGGFSFIKKTLHLGPQPKVIEENLVIPDTQRINGIEGKVASEVTGSTVQTPLVPKTESEKIIVTKAVLTVKRGYDLARPEAGKWASDALPAIVKSLGAVTLDGKSSQWQIVFSSASAKASADKTKTKQKGYEVIIQADKIVSQKEIDSTAFGAAFPGTFKDSERAIQVLQELPQFSDATVSAISLSYNTDGNAWYYALTTSRGLASIKAQ